MLTYPLKFSVSAHAKPGVNINWETSSASQEKILTASIPPEFAGPGGGFSPEDLYALAIVNCFVATFKVYAEKSQLNFEDVKADLTLEVDRDEKGFPWMARAQMQVTLKKPSAKDKAESLLQKALKGCLVMNSIKTEKTVIFNVVE